MYEFRTRIRFSETDSSRRLTVPALIDLLQDTASFHSEDCGWTGEAMRQAGIGWFILSWQIDMIRTPVMGEEIRVRTYSVGTRGLYVYRDFRILDDTGADLMRAHSIWVLMDLHAMRPLRPDPVRMESYGHDEGVPGDWTKRKIRVTAEADLPKAGSFQVSSYMLDSNHHMNNAFYIEEAMHILGDVSLPDLTGIRAEYRKQTGEGETLTAYRGETEQGTAVELRGADGSVSAVVIFRTGEQS